MSSFKEYFQTVVVIGFTILVCFLLQVSVFSNFPLAHVTPNILICVVATYGFMKGRSEGLIIGFIVGLILDFYSGFYLGFNAIIYMYIGYLNGFFKRLFFGDELRLPILLIAASDFIYGLLEYLCLFFTRQKFNFSFYALNIIIPEVVYTVIASIFVYYFLLYVNNKMEKLKKKGSDRFGDF